MCLMMFRIILVVFLCVILLEVSFILLGGYKILYEDLR